MALELKVPSVGESIYEVTIGEWLKGPGDWVEKDEPIVALETDKASLEVPAPQAGKLTEVLKEPGDTAQIGDVIAKIDETAEKPAGGEAKSDGGSKSEAKSESGSKSESGGESKSETTSDGGSKSNGGGDQRVMPAAQRMMAQHGVAQGSVSGSGPGGRVLKEDVQRHLTQPPAPTQRVGGARETEVVKMTTLRKRIAQRLVQSQLETANLTTFNEVDLTEVINLRNQFKDAYKEKYGIKLGFMSFFVKATIEALKQQPELNAQIKGDDEIVYHNYYDIGVAVGGGRGLVVPVIRNAELLSFAEVELTIADFARRAQANKLTLDELQGGTFTISNGGVYGSLLSTPILNPPQVGILGMHNIQERPIAVNGQVEIRPMMYIAMSYDHRIVDGREAVTFLKRIKECVENPSRILLEI